MEVSHTQSNFIHSPLQQNLAMQRRRRVLIPGPAALVLGTAGVLFLLLLLEGGGDGG